MTEKFTDAIMKKLRNLSEQYEKKQLALASKNIDQERHKFNMKRIENDVRMNVMRASVVDPNDPEKTVKKYTNETQRNIAVDQMLQKKEDYQKVSKLFVDVSAEISKLSVEIDILKYKQRNAVVIGNLHVAQIQYNAAIKKM